MRHFSNEISNSLLFWAVNLLELTKSLCVLKALVGYKYISVIKTNH